MKKLFFSLIALMVATMSYAQSNLVATLSHSGEISVFHGAGSLGQAMEAADHGDIITLSSGRYNAASITKAITLRGAGMEEDAATGTYRTHIVGDFNINIPDSLSEHLTMEGIYHENVIRIYGILNNAMLQKCRFKRITQSKDNNIVNSLTVIHCFVTEYIILPNNTSASFISSVIVSPQNSGGNMEFTNCVIHGIFNGINNSYFQNCIFNGSYALKANNMATYCAGYCDYSGNNPFSSLSSQATNKVLTTEQVNALFEPNTFYVLTEEAKAEYIGQDDTEMGIYGGNLPYDNHILSPQITKCNVAAKTTADGKLSVDIEVKAAE